MNLTTDLGQVDRPVHARLYVPVRETGDSDLFVSGTSEGLLDWARAIHQSTDGADQVVL